MRRVVRAPRSTSRPVRPPQLTEESLPLALSVTLAVTVIPVVVVARNGIELAPIDFIGPALLVVMLLKRSLTGARLQFFARATVTMLWVTILLALASVSIVATGGSGSDATPLRQLGSLVFSFRPFIFFFVGLFLADRLGYRMRRIILPLGISAAITCIVVTVGLWLSGEMNYQYGDVDYGGSIQYGEHLGGTYLGLSLYGRYGVNSLAETYAVYCALVLSALVCTWRENKERSTIGGTPIRTIVLVCGLVSAVHLSVSSQSRQAILAIVVVLGLSAIGFFLKVPVRMRHTSTIIILGVAGLIVGIYVVSKLLALEDSGSLDTYSAGRVNIAHAGWSTIWEKPFRGTGFAGGIGDQGSFNAHNIFLNIAYKMGLLGALSFLGLLICITMPSVVRLLRGASRPDVLVVDLTWVVLVSVVGLVSNSLDVVTASGPLLLLVGVYLGATTSHQEAAELVIDRR